MCLSSVYHLIVCIFGVGVHPCCWRDLASRTLFLLCEFLTFKNATICHLIVVLKISVSVLHLHLFKGPIIDLCVFMSKNCQKSLTEGTGFHEHKGRLV